MKLVLSKITAIIIILQKTISCILLIIILPLVFSKPELLDKYMINKNVLNFFIIYLSSLLFVFLVKKKIRCKRCKEKIFNEQANLIPYIKYDNYKQKGLFKIALNIFFQKKALCPHCGGLFISLYKLNNKKRSFYQTQIMLSSRFNEYLSDMSAEKRINYILRNKNIKFKEKEFAKSKIKNQNIKKKKKEYSYYTENR